MKSNKIDISQLRTSFVQSFNSKINDLENVKSLIDSGSATIETITALNFMSHNLSGSLGIFGFNEIEPISRALEEQSSAMLENGNSDIVLKDIIKNLNQLIQLMKDSI